MRGLFDIHCHLVPYVDDGARNMDEAVKMLKMEYSQGVRYVIVTPHYRRGMFETPMDQILTQFLKLRGISKSIGIQMFLGCEYHVEPEMVRVLRARERPCMASSPYVLAEFGYDVSTEYMREQLYMLLSNGYLPIVAHVERYGKVCRQWSFLEDIVDMGAFIQVNAGSILGESGHGVKKFCRRLMREDLLHFVGSDAHRMDVRKPNLRPCVDYVTRVMGEDYAEEIFVENPKKIVTHR